MLASKRWHFLSHFQSENGNKYSRWPVKEVFPAFEFEKVKWVDEMMKWEAEERHKEAEEKHKEFERQKWEAEERRRDAEREERDRKW